MVVKFKIGTKYYLPSDLGKNWFIPIRRTDKSLWITRYTEVWGKIKQVSKDGGPPISKEEKEPYQVKIRIHNGVEQVCPSGSHYTGAPVILQDHTIKQIYRRRS